MKFPSRSIIYISAFMLLARVLADVMAPSQNSDTGSSSIGYDNGSFVLSEIVPVSFKGWALDPSIITVQPNEEGDLRSRIYDQNLARGYRDENGNLIMLVIAYGHNQSDALQLHRPEVCYVANGFKITSIDQQDVKIASIPNAVIPSLRLITVSSIRSEIVTYWTRVGSSLPTSNLSRQFEKLKFGLSGNIPDGVLVRVSSISDKPVEAYRIQDKFINDLISVIDEKNLEFFLGPIIQNDKRKPKHTSEYTPEKNI